MKLLRGCKFGEGTENTLVRRRVRGGRTTSSARWCKYPAPPLIHEARGREVDRAVTAKSTNIVGEVWTYTMDYWAFCDGFFSESAEPLSVNHFKTHFEVSAFASLSL